MTANYRYFFGTLQTERVVTEIPLTGTYLDMELNVGGQFQGTFQLDQTGKRNQDLLDGTIPGRCFVAVERNGIPIWVGFVWSRTYSAQSKTCQLFCLSFENYPKKRLIRSTFRRTNIEQRIIFQDLWAHMQAVTGGNLNVNPQVGAIPNVVLKSVDVIASDFKYYWEIMTALANGSDGFDWFIGVAKSNDLYIKRIVMGYPTLGQVKGPTSLVFEFPGAITQYYMTESMAEAGTHIFGLGAGEGPARKVREIVQPNMISQGWPRWDQDVTFADITTQSQLDALTAQYAALRKPPALNIKATIKGDYVPEFGAYNIGDFCTLTLKDARNPIPLSSTARLIKWKLQPTSSENVEEAELLFTAEELE